VLDILDEATHIKDAVFSCGRGRGPSGPARLFQPQVLRDEVHKVEAILDFLNRVLLH
jgi:hypothetical protein